MNKYVLSIGILLLIGAIVVSSTRYIAIESNASVIYFKMGSQTVLLDENFSGTYPPEGWETGFFDQNNSSCCDSEPPCVRGKYSDPYYDNFMKSKAIDASNYEKCIIKFYFGAQFPYGSYSNVYLKYRRNETSPWIDITPWTNPIDDVCEYYETEITYDTEGCGEALQIMWQFLGYYYYYLHNTCIDDVKILGIPINSPPSAPIITGPTQGDPNIPQTFTFQADDPDNDMVRYHIDWGDGFVETTNFDYIPIDKSHTYTASGRYTITAYAEDSPGNVGPNGTFLYVCPRDKATNNVLLWRLVERFPLLERLYYLLN